MTEPVHSQPVFPTSSPEEDSSRWISKADSFHGHARRLFVFPHAGGGPAFFREWCRDLAPEVRVCRILLPGRESRLKEKPVLHMTGVVRPIVEAILHHTKGEFALFGHSLGAAIAFEVARSLQAAGAPPAQLFVSGRRAPHLPARREHIHELPDARFLRALRSLDGTPEEVFQQPELLRIFLPLLRADFCLNERYSILPGEELRCPIVAYAGDADPEVTQSELRAWRHLTLGSFATRVFPGNHFYLRQLRTSLIADLRNRLSAYPRTVTPRE